MKVMNLTFYINTKVYYLLEFSVQYSDHLVILEYTLI